MLNKFVKYSDAESESNISFFQYYEMSYGLNVEMHKQVTLDIIINFIAQLPCVLLKEYFKIKIVYIRPSHTILLKTKTIKIMFTIYVVICFA